MGSFVIKFIREIPESRLVQKELNDLEQFGFTLVWKKDSVEVYAEVLDTQIHSREERRAA